MRTDDPVLQQERPTDRPDLRILIVDDDETDRRMVRRHVRKVYPSAILDEATSAADALSSVGTTAYDCILLDYLLPDATATSLVPRIQAAASELPVVMLTGHGDEEIAIQLMKLGVADYISKSSVTADRLAIAVRHALALAEANANQRRAEAELHAQEAMFHAVADTIPQLAWTMNANGERTWFNKRWLDYTGTTLDEMRGWGWQKVLHPEHLSRVMASLRQSLRNGLPWEETVPLRGRDGTYRWFLVRALPVRRQNGTIETWFGTNTDVTERLATEQTLRDSEARLKRALDIETVGVLFFDLDDVITHANDGFLRMSGLSQEDLATGRLRRDELTPVEWIPCTLRAAEEFKSTGRTTPYEREFLRKDGSRWWALVTAIRLNEFEGVKFVIDITALKDAEGEARRSADRAEAAVAAKNRFLATVTHDIRQPLQILVGAHRRLKSAVMDEQTDKWLSAAEVATNRLIRAADQLAHLSRLESGALNPERKVFSIHPLLSELVGMARPRAREKGLELVLQSCDAHVESDPDMLRSILDNLVGNAIKYTERGFVTISCKQAERIVRIEVADTGVGIQPEKLQEIFYEYVRLDAHASDGLGLGLAIVSREAELLGHPLQVESTVAVGSCFRIEVPLGGVD